MPTQDWHAPGGGGGGGGNQARRLPKDLTGTPWVPQYEAEVNDPDSATLIETMLSQLQSAASRVKELNGGRPTGKAVAVLEPSSRREQVVGILSYSRAQEPPSSSQAPRDPPPPPQLPHEGPPVYFLPMDPRLPPCLVSPMSARSQPEELLTEARAAAQNPQDFSLRRTLLSGRVIGWPEGSELPLVELRASLGQVRAGWH